MSKRKHKRPSLGAYVAVPKRITDAPAWRAMSPWARLLWIDARAWLRNDGSNNGTTLHRSCREAARAIGCDKKTAARSFAELDHYGFVRRTAPGFLGSDGFGIAAKYRFTDLAHGTHPPTRDYEKWDGVLFAYVPRRGDREERRMRPKPMTFARVKRSKIEEPWKAEGISRRTWYRRRGGTLRGTVAPKPVPPNGTPCTPERYIRTVAQCQPVCTVPRDIDGTEKRTVGRYTTSFPPPSLAPDQEQRGSSTERAPALTGDAGSTPAPVSKPDLATVAAPPAQTNGTQHQAATEPAEKKPWSTPAVEGAPIESLPTELRMLALSLPDPARAPLAVDAVAGAPNQTEPTVSAEEAGPVVASPVPAAERTNGNGGERRLSSLQVHEHARWYSDEAYWRYSPNAIAAGELDAALRANLCKEVLPEHVEIEFERVMKAIRR